MASKEYNRGNPLTPAQQQFGNKNAVGNSGRPRRVTPPTEELDQLGKDLVEFVSDKKNKVLHISEWWSTKMFFLESVWKTMITFPEFFPYYEQAMRIIGKQYIDKTSNVRDGISHRWQRVYFKDLKKEEDETAIFNASLSEKSNITDLEAAKKFVEDLKDQIMRQEALNNSRTNNNTDIIS